MKIFSAPQIKAWDAFSITEEGISSAALMERAAAACYNWIVDNYLGEKAFHVFCGKGNNGGDGLALARMLLRDNLSVNVYILELGKPGTPDFQANLEQLHLLTTNIHFIQSGQSLPVIGRDSIVVDALFGTGLNKPLDGIAKLLVEHINSLGCPIISIDLPSGLFCDISSKEHTVVTATDTLSFQNIKLAFLMAENHKFVGEFHLLDIGLSKHFEFIQPTVHETTGTGLIKNLVKPRDKFSHKGSFGHAALVAGSYGMMGAAVLAARACLQSGTGKLTCYIPSCGYEIIQSTIPEAMCRVTGDKFIIPAGNLAAYDAIGLGPGIGVHPETANWLSMILNSAKPCVLDADALNIIGANPELLERIPAGSVITPHPKEFERMFGETTDNFNQLELALEKAAALKIYIVLKGHYTAIITPKGKVYFNSSGNAGMAKGGMGDVLTGMITGFISQHYSLPEAAILAVYLHGAAGDIAAARYSQPAMQASDLLDCIPDAWRSLLQ